MNDVHLRSTTVHVGRQRLRVTVEQPGAGRPLLLINGIGATGDLFRPFRQHLTDRETIAFDAPGVGGSPAPCYPPTMRQLATIVAGVIDELGHEQVDVLGLSWGGALAQELTRRHPQAVRRLVLAATMSGWTSLPGRPLALTILMSPMRYYSPGYLERVAPTLYGGAIREHPALLREHGRLRAAQPPSPVGYTYQLAALRRWTSLPWLHRLTQPTLVLAGSDDPIVPLPNARLLAFRIPAGRLHVVDRGGHLFVFTHAEQVAATIREFLDA
ncbi:MAG: alpha/beta fold hydrolase [Ilumatobacteraceae bacterium]